MTTFDIVIGSALGQLLALALVGVSWLVWQVGRLAWTFGVAASKTRVAIIAQQRKSCS